MTEQKAASAQVRKPKRDKRYGYIVTAIEGDPDVVPTNLSVGSILLEKRSRGTHTIWDFINFDTGAMASAVGRKIGVGYAVDGQIEWVGGTPPEALPNPSPEAAS